MTLEQEWIHHLQTRWPNVDLRHDTFYDSDSRQILTTDMLVEGVHFKWDYFKPEDLGWKSIAVNLSDIAATGGKPHWVLVSMGVPPDHPISILERVYSGMEACCREFGCTIVGGDTVAAQETTVSVTIIGYLPAAWNPGRRHSAKPGDMVAVSGTHGLSQAGLVALQHKLPGYNQAKEAHLRPLPQVKLGQRIAQVLPAFAMMDSSDGLADAALRMAQASQVDIVLDKPSLPLHSDVVEIAAHQKADPWDWVLYGGEDFQLVVCLPPEAMILFPQLKAVGRVQAASQTGQGRAFLREGTALFPLDAERTFQHFPTSAEAMTTAYEEFPIP